MRVINQFICGEVGNIAAKNTADTMVCEHTVIGTYIVALLVYYSLIGHVIGDDITKLLTMFKGQLTSQTTNTNHAISICIQCELTNEIVQEIDR